MSAPTACYSAAPAVGVRASVRPFAPKWLVLAAFAAVYVIWGSTYLAIHVAVTTIPPFLMAGARFLIAGGVLYAAVRLRGAPSPRPAHWQSATIAGALLLLVGNGALSWVQKYAPSNLTAIMVAATPLWMNLCDWLRPGGRRPLLSTMAGIAIGFIGVALVVLHREPGGARVVEFGPALVLLLGPLSWAIGSIYSRHAVQSPVSLQNTAMQMLCGGALMAIVGVARGEATGFALEDITRQSAWAFVYLTFLGSLVGFTAYAYILQVSTPARVSTYAYVNPLIAVVLGSVVLHEKLPPGMLLAGALILLSVVTITTRTSRSR